MTFERRTLWLASAIIGFAALFGALLEVYQSTLSGREASVFDALANLLGAVAGVAFATFIWPRLEAWIRRG
jgi:VanZ family protein